jgi:hypothetical protein
MAVSFIGGVSTLRKPQILKEDAFFFLQYELSISSFLGNDKKGLLPVMLLTYLQHSIHKNQTEFKNFNFNLK